MITTPKNWLVAQGSVTTPKLDIALWQDEPTKEAYAMAASLHKAGYFSFNVFNAEGKQLMSISVEEQAVKVNSKIVGA